LGWLALMPSLTSVEEQALYGFDMGLPLLFLPPNLNKKA